MPVRANLVGRDREQALLRELLAEACFGHGGLVLVAGEAGVGKTALVDWLGQEAREQGAGVVQGGCYDLTVTPPYGPWTEAIAGFGTAHPLLQFAGALDGNQALLFQQVREYLADEARAQALVLVLEDLHWSDPASLELLRFVARGAGGLPLLLVATYRADEPSYDRPLYPLLPLLVREGRATRIDLGALDAAAVHTLVAARYLLAPERVALLATYLHGRSGGNPLYVNEILRTLQQAGLLFESSVGWDIGDLAVAPLPPLVRQVIENRLAGLDNVARELLETAAIIGQDVPLDLLQAVGVSPFPDAALQRAKLEHLLVEAPSGEHVSFVHALVRETLYFDQPLARRRAAHRTVAELLVERRAVPPQLIASHFAAADDPRAIDWFIRAGERALALYAARDAAIALTHAQELAQRHGQDLPAEAFRARAVAHGLLGEFDQARRDHETVLELLRGAGDVHGEWQALADLGMLWAERDYERTGGYYHAALALARTLDDQVLIAHSLNRIANWHANLDEPEVALPLHREALDIFEACDEPAGIADTLDLLGMTSYLSCDYISGLRYYERALTLVRASDDRQRVYSCLVAMQLLGGEQDTAIAAPVYREAEFWKRCGDEALALAREMGWVAGEAFALAMRSFTAGPRGALGPALADAQAAVALAERAGHRQWITAARLALGMAWMALHQLEHASSAMDAALTDARRIGSIFWVSSVAAGLASLWIEQGNLVRAEALLEEVSSSERLGASSGQRQCWYARAELALSRQQPERALDYIDRLLESRPHPESDHGIPALTKLRGDALTQLGRTAEAEAEYRGAREGACLFGYLPLLWRVDAAHGALLLAEGRTTEAETAVHAARSTIAGLAESIDADAVREHFHAAALARLPVLPEPDSARSAGLSPRELEVLRLLSEGQSDREIADALSISPRTVMRHVSGIFDKLGVGSRTAAATLAIRRNLV